MDEDLHIQPAGDGIDENTQHPGERVDEDVQHPVNSMDVVQPTVNMVQKTPRKYFRYCSALNCLTKVPNSSDINLHIVKEEWFQNTIPWKREIPRWVCDLHFTSDCFKTSYVEGRKNNRLKSDSKPLTG